MSLKIKNKSLLFMVILLMSAVIPSYATETFVFRGDSSKMTKPRGKKEIILSGNASISSDTLIIKADRIRRFGNDLQFTVCTGNVKARDLERDIEITCEHLFFDTDADTMTIESKSELYDKKNDVVTKSGYLFDNRKDKMTFLSINVRIFQDNVVCRSEFAQFDHNSEKIELTGNPIIYKDGNEMSAFRIFYDIETEEIELIGNVSGSIESEEENDEQKTNEEKIPVEDEKKPGVEDIPDKPPVNENGVTE